MILQSEPAAGGKRTLAFLIDLVVIYAYVFALLAASIGLNSVWPFHQHLADSYALRHLISFATLTLPVLLYFILMERSRWRGTIGKRVMRLAVVSDVGEKSFDGSTSGGEARPEAGAASNNSAKPSFRQLVLRNVVKFAPWEMAHIHFHLNPDFFTTGATSTAGWILGLVLPQALVLGYALMIFVRRDHRAPYELLSGTSVVV